MRVVLRAAHLLVLSVAHLRCSRCNTTQIYTWTHLCLGLLVLGVVSGLVLRGAVDGGAGQQNLRLAVERHALHRTVESTEE